MKVLYLDLFSGASGDMLLGALLDLGLPLEELQGELGKLALCGYMLEAERRVQRGLSGTHLRVRDMGGDQPARNPGEIRRLIGASALSPAVRERAIAVFERLGRVEAQVHGIPLEEVHFHEIGAVDSLVDIVGFIAGLERLGVEKVFSSPVPLGSGSIETEHGRLPVPAPATLLLLAEVQAPTCPHPAQGEIVTPTAAALLAELATFSYPPMRVGAVGYGFGQTEFPWANALRAWLGETVEPGAAGDRVVLLECNLDDATGEELGFAMEQILAAGALDVYFTPIQMKKGRPGTLLGVLARPEEATALAQVILRHTSTLGLRLSPPLARVLAERRVRQVETPWGVVHVKEKWLNGERLGDSPEYEDCARIAREHGLSLGQVLEAVKRLAG